MGFIFIAMLDCWIGGMVWGMGEVGGGGEIFLTLRNIFGLILNHVRYDDSRLVQKYNEFKINATFLVIINPCSISESFEGHIMQM